MYERLERKMTDEERQPIVAAVNLEVPKDDLLFGIPGVRDKLIENLKKKQARNQAILDDGHVVVHRCKTDAVARLMQTEDEGDSYFYDVGAGQIFCYCFYQEAMFEPEVWPNNDFQFVHTRLHPTRHFEWLTCNGVEIEPIRTIEGSMELWELLPKTSVQLIQGSLDSIENDLKHREV